MRTNIISVIVCISILALTSACSVKRPIVQAADEDGYYNTDISISHAAVQAVGSMADEVSSQGMNGKLAIVTISNNKKYETIANEAYIAILNKGIKAVKVNERDVNNKIFDNMLVVYPTVYGVESPYTPPPVNCVLPALPKPGYSGRRAKVTIYARLENIKSGIIKFEKEFSSQVDEFADLSARIKEK